MSGNDSPRDPATLLDRAGVRGDPDRDQHFLIDGRVLDRIVDYARERVPDPDHAMEIGPGTGALTDRLLGYATDVTAIERDGRLCTFLRREFTTAIDDDSLTVIEGVALEVALPEVDIVVANLPYGVASQIIFRLLPRRWPMVLLVQREFGERLVAEPGTDDYGRATVTAGHYAAVELCEVVPPSVFQPPPPVESAVVAFEPRAPPYDGVNDDIFMRVVTAMFTQRRKTVRNAIRNTTHISEIDDAEAVLSALPADWLDRRPATLAPADFADIARIVEDLATDRSA